MNTINVLIAIDSLAALASNNLKDNVYMVDTNKHIGSWNEGTSTLYTVVQDGQIVSWRVVPISASSSVEITAFGGDMVTKSVCKPSKQGIAGATFWEGQVENHGSIGQFDYSITLSIDGKSMSFSPFLKIV